MRGKQVGKWIETTINTASVGFGIKDLIDKFFSSSGEEDGADVQFDFSDSLGSALGAVRRQITSADADASNTTAVDSTDADTTADADADGSASDTSSCSIDKDKMESAASDALSKTQDLLSLSRCVSTCSDFALVFLISDFFHHHTATRTSRAPSTPSTAHSSPSSMVSAYSTSGTSLAESLSRRRRWVPSL